MMRSSWSLLFWFLICVITPCGSVSARDDTLEFYLSKADLVVIGTLLDPVTGGMSSGPIGKPGEPVFSYLRANAHVQVIEVIKGKAPATQPLLMEFDIRLVSVGPTVRLTDEQISEALNAIDAKAPVNEAPFGFKKGEKYIFFLRRYPPESKSTFNGEAVMWQAVDPWFGVLPLTEALALGLRQAAH